MKKKKFAQFYLTDFFVALLIFIILTGIYHVYSENLSKKNENNFNKLILDAKLISNSLLSEGVPSNWSYQSVSNILRLGILTPDKEIDIHKLSRLYNLTFNETYPKFSVINNYYIFLNDKDGQIIDIANKTTSGYYDNTSQETVKISRIVPFNKTLTELNIWVWY